MRSSRASAAWAGIALATSFLSVGILCAQPRPTAASAAAAVTASASSIDALKPDVTADGKLTRIRAERGAH